MTVLLPGARVEAWISDRAIIDAPAALIGRDDETPAESTVAALEVQVRGLDAMTGIAPIARVQIPRPPAGTRHLDWKWGAEGNPDSTQVWADDCQSVSARSREDGVVLAGVF